MKTKFAKSKAKTILLFLCLFQLNAIAQNGLESVIVEKFYVSNAADSIGSAGSLPVGSVTYRVYVDMLPGYRFQVLYGIPSPLHELKIATTTQFFNNEFLGDVTPSFSRNNARQNTMMLDSWLTVGAACAGNFGVLKSDDNGVNNVVNANGLLQNNDPLAGIPLTTQDGFLSGTPESPTFVGITAAELEVFNNISGYGNLFSTSNGALSSLNGSVGPTSDNKILIGQFTTNGDFSFELNIQIRSASNVVENYVAKNPVGNERSIPSLTYPLNFTPVVNLTSPIDGSSYFSGDVVSLQANASDSLGSISQVEFFVNNVSIGTDATAPYQINWNAVGGNPTIHALATDNSGLQGFSDTISINVITNQSPTVSIDQPLNNSTIVNGSNVNIMATSNDADGTVIAVRFYSNGTLLCTDSIAPYECQITPSTGTYTLTAVAVDNYLFETTSGGIQITVVNNTPPTAAITAPANNAVYLTGNNVIIEVLAIDNDGTVDHVDCFVNGTLIGTLTTPPFQFTWPAVSGTASISAIAYDNYNASGSSGIININIQNSNSQVPFTPGNIVVYRVGDGNGILVNTGNPVFLDEYTTSGTLVQSIALPTSANGLNRGLVASGTGASEGYMTTAADGHSLFLTGYDGLHSSSLPGSLGSVKNRVIAKVDPLGNINTSTALADYADGGNPRTVVSSNGTDIWMAGSLGGVRYTTVGSTSSVSISSAVTGIRQLNIFNDQLYATGNTSSTFRIGTVGTGLPTTGSQPMNPLPGIPVNSGSPVAFYFTDLNSGISGVDVLYVADEGGLVYKYSLVSNTWTLNGSLPVSSVRGLTGKTNGQAVSLFATRGTGSSNGGGEIFAFTDSTGYNQPMTTSATSIVTANNQTTFRGVAFVPEPCYPVAIQVQPVSPGPLCDQSDTVQFTVSVTGSGPYTYQWQENSVNIADGGLYSGTNTSTLTLTNPGIAMSGNTYRCIVTNCYGSNTVITDNLATLTINPNPSVNVTPDGPFTFCAGDSVVLSAGPHTTYQWTNGDTDSITTIVTSGVYSVTVSNTFGCTTASTPDTATVNSIPVMNITAGSSLTFCDGDSVALLANSGLTSYLWSNGSTTAQIYALTSGNYFVTGIDSNGCSGTSPTVIVNVNPLPVATITALGDTTFCPGDSVELLANSGMGFTYLWSDASVTQGITINISDTLTVTVTDVNGCSNTSTPIIIIRFFYPSDFNESGVTEVDDFLLFITKFGSSCNGCNEDLNNDSQVTILDYLIFVSQFGLACPY